MYWKNKACLITGGSAGLGQSIAQALVERGGRVMIVGRRQDALDAAVAEMRHAGGTVVPVAADVVWQEDVDRIAAMATSEFGGLDFVCHSAGRSARATVLDTTPEDFQQLLDVNFLAAVRITRAVAPMLLASRGHLVNIGSLAAKVAAPYMGAYPASKFPLAAYSQQLRLELGPQGLHVLLVCPGPISRPDGGVRYVAGGPVLPREAQAPGAGAKVKAIDPARLAADVLRACERRRPELVVPGKARVLFALAQISPSWGDWLLRRSMKG